MNDFFKNIPEVQPDEWDLEMLKSVEKRKDNNKGKTLQEIEYNGKILVRVPKSLHKELVAKAKNEGVSLNQFIAYKLSQQ
jgi:predicted HicB family RNase H-like nuclease